MAAPKGNQYAKGHKGTEKMFTPDELRRKFEEYFKWCDKHPIKVKESIKSGINAGQIIIIEKVRPYLIEGLIDYLPVDPQTFYNYEKKEGYEDYFDIVAWARNKVYTQNLELGYVGEFDSGLVARKLRLAEKSEINAMMLNTSPLSHEEMAKARKDFENEL